MHGNWGRFAAGAAIFAGCSLALSPAVGRVESVLTGRSATVSLDALGSIGSFTPVTSDARLARRYAAAVTTARSQGFRFTPSVGSMSGRRSITVVVRAPDLSVINGARSSTPSTIGLGPVAYNLGSARGLSRFATEISGLRGDAVPLVAASALTPPHGFKLEERKRLSTNIELESLTATGAAPLTLAGEKGYAVDLGSSYKLTRNLDVTAGVRYRGRQNRLGTLTDEAQDSQAVYLGTTFKF
ncbi:opacity family porin [Sphingobium sufflavum]|uniref:opacity family porin n=1 Tax=Sphingobium sufflavum TaxID=1129547 RepID=UPI001F198706|nr:opacity family porin [Sphingobium sufflavum]MCE7795047.1 opacity family porin [Sphingobium sufflavum]